MAGSTGPQEYPSEESEVLATTIEVDQRLLDGLRTGEVPFEALRNTVLAAYLLDTGKNTADFDALVNWLRRDDKLLGLQIAKSPTLQFGIFASIEDKDRGF